MDSQSIIQYSHLLKSPLSGKQMGVFGYQLSRLPDFLNDHTLIGSQPSEHLEEVLLRFGRFLTGLRKFPNTAYTLRYISDPERGAIHTYVLGRFNPDGRSALSLEHIRRDLEAHLSSFRMPASALSNNDRSLAGVLSPFEKSAALVEIRQHERLVPLMSVDRDAYVIHPFWEAGGALLEPFETLLSLQAPVAISIYLEPTQVSPAEYEAISEAAHLAQTLADLDVKTFSDTGLRRRRDPGAELVGRIYSQYLNSLVDPFISVVQVLSPDPGAAWTVARAFTASAITVARQARVREQSQSDMPSEADYFIPENPAEQAAALSTFEYLDWRPWGKSLASPGKERLRYLMGARGATTIFRFPISVHGGVPGIQVEQQPPDFAPGPRPDQIGAEEIHLGDFHRGGAATVNLKDLTRHTLITGFTGSGKTNTVLYLLDQLWRNHRIPFLVIESAKKEYRALLEVAGFEDLLIFTLGDETISPFRLNPFEIMPGVRVEAHIGRLQACFDAALPQFGILPSIIAEALEIIYKNKRWKLTDRAEDGDKRLFPTMRELFDEVIRVSEDRGYAGETRQNIRAAAAGRIGNLLRGSRGRMFGGQRSHPADVIFRRPVILELNDLNPDDKALTMMFLLTWLREYRELHKSHLLQHVTVVEEAHNVLSNTQSVGNQEISADTKAKAVAAFADMLAEVRAYGEGLVISDQSPEKLAPDALRNTNLQISHQLRDSKDREAIGRGMIMDETQKTFIGKLRIGQAAFFRTGIEKATFIQVPEYKDSAGFNATPADERVREKMAPFQRENLIHSLPYNGCRFCGSPCEYREAIEPYTLDKEKHEQLIRSLKLFDENPQRAYWAQHWRGVAAICGNVAAAAGHSEKLDAAYCYMVHEIPFPFTKHMRDSFVDAFKLG